MLGIYAVMNNLYQVTSNRESGLGRYDIQMKPINKMLPGIIIELKVPKENIPKETIEEQLMALASDAVSQIESKNYSAEMHTEGISKILKIGIAFYKKQVKLIMKH